MLVRLPSVDRRCAFPLLAPQVKVWDSSSCFLLRTLRAHRGEITDMNVHPSGGLLASASNDQTVRIWDAATGKLQRELQVVGFRLISFFSLLLCRWFRNCWCSAGTDGSFLRRRREHSSPKSR